MGYEPDYFIDSEGNQQQYASFEAQEEDTNPGFFIDSEGNEQQYASRDAQLEDLMGTVGESAEEAELKQYEEGLRNTELLRGDYTKMFGPLAQNEFYDRGGQIQQYESEEARLEDQGGGSPSDIKDKGASSLLPWLTNALGGNKALQNTLAQGLLGAAGSAMTSKDRALNRELTKESISTSKLNQEMTRNKWEEELKKTRNRNNIIDTGGGMVNVARAFK